MAGEEGRESWGSRASFLLACIGYAVGLGNIWRFPYNAYKSGGGAFLLPYLVMLGACGVPLLFMELAVGQYTRRGPIGALGKLCPLLQGAGLGTVIISFLLCTYYNVILAWSLFYLGASLQSPLPWASCGNWWNSARCLHQASVHNLSSNVSGVSATQEYFEGRVLQQTAGIHQPGHLRLELLGLLTAAWVIVYFCLWKGVTLTGKVVYVTATLPILLLLAFTIRGLSLPGAVDGVLFFITPDWSRIAEPQIWVSAASQVFNSIGIAFGSLIAFASYNKFEGPVLRDTLIVTLADALVSLLCGVAVFAVLGNLAHQQGAEVGTVVEAGPGLVFVVFPHALATMPFPQLWSVVFFSLVVMLGVDSQFATVEVIITSVKDGWEGTKLCSHEVLVLIICLLAFLAGIPNTFQGGIYWFTIIDYYSATISLMYVALFETVAVVWCYGVDRLAANVADMTGSAPGALCRLAWRLVAPGLIAVMWGFTLVEYRPPSRGASESPAWVLALGWGLASLSLASIPGAALRAMYRVERGTAWQRLVTALTSTILHCPCCGAKLDHQHRAHYRSPGEGGALLHHQKPTPV